MTLHRAGQTLKSLQHAQIDILDSLFQIDASIHSYLKIKPILRQLQDKIFSYFQLQKDDFYGYLFMQFDGDQKNENLIEALAEDLKDFKVKCLLFFDDHPADMGDVHPRQFPLHFKQFSAQVSGRFKMEKDYLFPLLENSNF